MSTCAKNIVNGPFRAIMMKPIKTNSNCSPSSLDIPCLDDVEYYSRTEVEKCYSDKEQFLRNMDEIRLLAVNLWIKTITTDQQLIENQNDRLHYYLEFSNADGANDAKGIDRELCSEFDQHSFSDLNVMGKYKIVGLPKTASKNYEKISLHSVQDMRNANFMRDKVEYDSNIKNYHDSKNSIVLSKQFCSNSTDRFSFECHFEFASQFEKDLFWRALAAICRLTSLDDTYSVLSSDLQDRFSISQINDLNTVDEQKKSRQPTKKSLNESAESSSQTMASTPKTKKKKNKSNDLILIARLVSPSTSRGKPAYTLIKRKKKSFAEPSKGKIKKRRNSVTNVDVLATSLPRCSFSDDAQQPHQHQPIDTKNMNDEICKHFEAHDFYFVTSEEKPHVTDYLYLLYAQIMPAIYSSDDNLKRNKRSNAATINITPGYPGFRCRHCKGSNGGNYFPSTCRNLQASPTTVHNHILGCSDCPSFIKNAIKSAQRNHRNQVMQVKSLSKENVTQVSFFERIWGRLHCNTNPLADIFDGSDKTHANDIKQILSKLVLQYAPLSNLPPSQTVMDKEKCNKESKNKKLKNKNRKPPQDLCLYTETRVSSLREESYEDETEDSKNIALKFKDHSPSAPQCHRANTSPGIEILRSLKCPKTYEHCDNKVGTNSKMNENAVLRNENSSKLHVEHDFTDSTFKNSTTDSHHHQRFDDASVAAAFKWNNIFKSPSPSSDDVLRSLKLKDEYFVTKEGNNPNVIFTHEPYFGLDVSAFTNSIHKGDSQVGTPLMANGNNNCYPNNCGYISSPPLPILFEESKADYSLLDETYLLENDDDALYADVKFVSSTMAPV